MRELVINTIVNNFFSGLDEITPIRYLDYKSDLHNKFEDLINKNDNIRKEYINGNKLIPLTELLSKKIYIGELIDLLNLCSDEMLLECLRGQHCQQFR